MNKLTLTNISILKIGALCGLLFLFLFNSALANTVVRSGDSININQDQIVDSDFYGAGTNVNLSGVMNRDVSILSGRVNINGPISEDLLLIAGDVSVYGPVGQSVRFLGGQIEIADSVSGNVFVIGANVTIMSTASVGGDLIVYGGDVNVEGEIGGSVLGSVRNMSMNSMVGGDVDIHTNSLTLGDRANIQGDLAYTSDALLNKSLNSIVVGETVRNDPVLPAGEEWRWSWVAPVIMLLFVSLLWWFLSPSSLNRLVDNSLDLSPKPIILGLSTFLVLPLLATLMFMSTIGIFVGILLMSLYTTALLLSIISIIPIIGRLVFKLVTKKPRPKITVLMMLTGSLVTGLLLMLGNIGLLVLLAFVLLALGSIAGSVIRFGAIDHHKFAKN